MIIRLLALVGLPVLAYYLARSLSRRFSLTPRQNQILFFIMAALLVIAVLVVLGRLPVHFIFAPLGAAGAFLLRFLPTLLRLAPFWAMLRGRVASAGRRSGNSASTIRTAYIAMELVHSTGNMDGEVVRGKQQGKQLSSLSEVELVDLLQECQDDPDSVQVLEAYLDRMHEDWRSETGQQSSAEAGAGNQEQPSESLMNKALALEILGLDERADRKAIVKAHRQLMQKLHPDRGGTDYLAQKINSAKDFLLAQLER